MSKYRRVKEAKVDLAVHMATVAAAGKQGVRKGFYFVY